MQDFLFLKVINYVTHVLIWISKLVIVTSNYIKSVITTLHHLNTQKQLENVEEITIKMIRNMI